MQAYTCQPLATAHSIPDMDMDVSTMLDGCALEVLMLMCQALDVHSLISAAYVSKTGTLSQAARASLAELATQTVTEAGLAWAVELDLAIGVRATSSQLPPRTALRHLPSAELIKLIRSTTSWLPDEEGRYKAAAAWRRCWRWWVVCSDTQTVS